MTAVMENLFTLAGVGPTAVDEGENASCLPEPEAGNVSAHSALAPQAPAAPPHPARDLQEDYVRAILACGEAEQAVERAKAAARAISFSVDRFDVSYLGLHRDAVNALVRRFKSMCLCGDVQLSDKDEFSAAFGEQLTEEIFESGSRRHHRYHEDDDQTMSPRDIRLDLIKLWDALALRHADGGVRLLRSQAAAQILQSWPLRDKPFEVVNGKSLIEDRVWSEASWDGRRRTLSYSSSESMLKLLRAIDVFLEFAEIEGSALHSFFPALSRHSTPDIVSGTKYVVSKGDLEFRTFNETWKWTLSARTADKLREFIVEYGNLAGDS